MTRLFVSLFFCIFFPTLVFSQATVKGRIIDSLSKQPLGFATVTVFMARDTVLQNYRISAPEGDFKVPGLPTGRDLRLLVSFTGYRVHRQEFRISEGESSFDIGTISLVADATSLDEVLVVAERPPVVVRRDTIEFNAASFKTLPNALVEDLLKKLPGVQVDRDGNIMVNGKPVNRIQVDGKTFFGDDPKMATRNLPANVIDKVQVTDDKDELARNGDDNMNNVGKVINITLKKGIKKGWFGKVYGGGGTDERYEAGGIANIYRDTLQVSVLGYMNNLNKAGFSFSELMQSGGFERSRSNSSSSSTSIWNYGAGGNGIQINGISFGGMQGQGGVSTSKGAGFNLNHSPSSKRSFFLQYFFGNVIVDRRTDTDLQQFKDDTVVTTSTRLKGRINSDGHNIGLGARLKPDSLTNILLNASYTIGLSDDGRLSNIGSVNNQLGQLSDGLITQMNASKTYFYRHSATITRLSKKKAGRRYTFSHNLDMNNRYNDYSTETEQRFYYPFGYDSVAAQLRVEKIPRTDANIGFNFSNPFTKKITLRTMARYELGLLRNAISTYDQTQGQGYDDLIGSLSSKIKRVSHRGFVSAGLEFKLKEFLVTPSARVLYQEVDNKLLSLTSPIHQQQTNLLPGLQVQYKTSNIYYSQDISLPAYTFLIPVTDNTNPYFIVQGNPDLLPTKRHNLGINYQYNNTRKSFNASVYSSAALVSNDVVQSITVDDKGVQTVRPINADGGRSVYLNFNVNKQYKNSQKLTFSWNAGGNYNYSRSRLVYNNESSWQSTFYLNNWVGGSVNWNDIIEFNPSFSTGHNFTRYTNPAFPKLKILTSYLDNELVVRWPKHIIWETQLNVSYNNSVPAGLPKQIVRWNGAVNITFGKTEASVFKLSMFDILDRNQGISVNASRNFLTSSETNVLQQYVMGTFTYNVRPNGVKKKVGGRERFNIF
ncbi:MAG: TonB-dependent receptor [Chitinophagaceae bacterium]|nr:MAG: TonB-dependent receptor [Chitinophagaceae bacterium]